MNYFFKFLNERTPIILAVITNRVSVKPTDVRY